MILAAIAMAFVLGGLMVQYQMQLKQVMQLVQDTIPLVNSNAEAIRDNTNDIREHEFRSLGDAAVSEIRRDSIDEKFEEINRKLEILLDSSGTGT